MTSPSPRVALATAGEEPDLDPEGRLLLRALAEAGLDAVPAVWDDAAQDWAAYDLVVVRSTWDYPPRLAAFLAWSQHVDDVSRILNGPELLAWTTDKRYLAGLAGDGVPTVRSLFLAPGEGPEHGLLDAEHVVKPTVSAGSLDTLRLGADEPGRSMGHVRHIHASGRTAMVQPYLDAVDSHGETALIYLDGRYSHAIRKGALLERGGDLVEGLFAEEEIEPREPDADERALGEACLGALPPSAEPPLYARVDLLRGAAGPLLLEIELAEPSLFLDQAPGAADRLAAAILVRLASVVE